jgi:hypothetical protein
MNGYFQGLALVMITPRGGRSRFKLGWEGKICVNREGREPNPQKPASFSHMIEPIPFML